MRRLFLAAGILMGVVAFAGAAERSPQTYAFDALTVDTRAGTGTTSAAAASPSKSMSLGAGTSIQMGPGTSMRFGQ